MSVQLLDKTRKINKLLHNNNSSKVVFNDICAVLTEILDSNVLVVSRKGKILGVSKSPDVQEISELITEAVGSHIDQMLNERLLSILSTKENVNLDILLGRTCPKPCSYSHLAVRKNGVSCLHSSTEELAKRQEVQ